MCLASYIPNFTIQPERLLEAFSRGFRLRARGQFTEEGNAVRFAQHISDLLTEW